MHGENGGAIAIGNPLNIRPDILVGNGRNLCFIGIAVRGAVQSVPLQVLGLAFWLSISARTTAPAFDLISSINYIFLLLVAATAALAALQRTIAQGHGSGRCTAETVRI